MQGWQMVPAIPDSWYRPYLDTYNLQAERILARLESLPSSLGTSPSVLYIPSVLILIAASGWFMVSDTRTWAAEASCKS